LTVAKKKQEARAYANSAMSSRKTSLADSPEA
jgi:hypothetical protein